MDKTNLTSVKILKELYKQFKLVTVNTKMSLQKVTNRSLFLYIHDEKFKQQIESTDALFISGSNF